MLLRPHFPARLHLSIHPSSGTARTGAPTSSCSSGEGPERRGASVSGPPGLFITTSKCRCAAAAPGDIFSPLQGITAASTWERQEGGREGRRGAAARSPASIPAPNPPPASLPSLFEEESPPASMAAGSRLALAPLHPLMPCWDPRDRVPVPPAALPAPKSWTQAEGLHPGTEHPPRRGVSRGGWRRRGCCCLLETGRH